MTNYIKWSYFVLFRENNLGFLKEYDQNVSIFWFFNK